MKFKEGIGQNLYLNMSGVKEYVGIKKLAREIKTIKETKDLLFMLNFLITKIRRALISYLWFKILSFVLK